MGLRDRWNGWGLRDRIAAVLAVLFGVPVLCMGTLLAVVDTSGPEAEGTATVAVQVVPATPVPPTAVPSDTPEPPPTEEPPAAPSDEPPPTEEPTAAPTDEPPPAEPTGPPPTEEPPPMPPTEAPPPPPSGHNASLAEAPPANQPWLPCAQGQFKANAESGVFHAPNQRDYRRTFANVVCYNTAEEARAAGYRQAER